MKFAEFERSKLDPARNVFAFVCGDEFLLQESRAVWARLFGTGWLIEKLHAKEFENIESSRLADDARTPSLFAESRAYMVTRAEKLKKDRIEDLTKLNDLPRSSVKVILALEELKTAQTLPAAFPRVTIDPVQSVDAARWIAQRYKTPPELARYIVEQVGAELFPLHHEMEKLQTYVGPDRPIEMRDVDASLLSSERFGQWDLNDAIFARSYAKAVRLIGAMLEAGDEPLIVLSQITRVWRQLFMAKGLAGRAGAAEVAMAAALAFKGAEIAAACRRYEWKQLAQGFRAILAADRAFKTSSPNPEVYFDVMLWKLMEGKSA